MKKYNKHIVFILSVFLLILSSDLFANTRGIKVSVKTSTGKTIELYHNSYALIVGNGNYTNGWDPLPGAVKDVKEISDALKRNGFKVELRTNLTKDGFNREFANFVYEHGKDINNRLLFYYAGHGYTQPMATGEELGYLVMVNAPAPEKDLVGFTINSIDMQSMVTQAKMIKAKHVLFIFDSCFSGTVLNLRERVTPNFISDNVKLPVRQFITAGRANEAVPDFSVFKQCFLDILEGRDAEPIQDGYLTGEELGLYLKNKVPSYNKNQHPQYGKIKDPKLDKGDFVFLLGSSGVIVEKPETPSKSNLYVDTQPKDARVRILNIGPKFYQGMALDAGSYHVEVSEDGYETQKKWVSLSSGQDKTFDIHLKPIATYGSTSRHKKRITNSLGMEFVYIPPGTFMMGSPSNEPGRDNDERQHRVTLTKGFYMQTTEVTQGQWKAMMGNNPSGLKNCGDKCPVEQVNWNDAQQFIRKLNRREGGNRYRLPTEAEWEYSARAGADTSFAFGRCLSTDQANYDGNKPLPGCSKGEIRGKTIPVASFKRNSWGLYDMHGNVWEWCQDWYRYYPSGSVTDPTGPSNGSYRVRRGGSWHFSVGYCRSANRYRFKPNDKSYDLGFRLVKPIVRRMKN